MERKLYLKTNKCGFSGLSVNYMAPSTYPPISLLSTLGKVFEKVVFKHLQNYMIDHCLCYE